MRVCNVLIVFLGLTLGLVNSARILGIFPAAAPSHYILGNSLMVELANRGHNVTYISAFERKTEVKNLKDVVLTGFVEEMDALKKTGIMFSNMNVFSKMITFFDSFAKVTNNTFKHPNVKKLLNSDEKFDLVIIETFLNEAQMGFGYHYKVPTIVISTVGASPMCNEYVRNVANPSYLPEMMSDLPPRMGFLARLKNTFMSIAFQVLMRLHQLPMQDEILHTYFPDAPPLEELMHRGISLVLMNSNSAFSMAKPTMPNMFEIGGFHVAEPKPLPKDLQQYLDNAKEGFILFSMGSNLKSTMLPPEFRKSIMTVFERLPYQVLWKFEDDQLEGKPKNVKIGKWLPQNDILAHPNIKLFITHGGLLSTTEAVYRGVPIVGIPVLGDQKSNMANSEMLGLGKTVQFEGLTTELLYESVIEVLNNQSYKENMQKRSALLRDQLIKPLDSAMYWIEYTLRHGYLDHLKTGAIDLKWYQVMLLDVIGTLLLGVSLILYIPYFIVKKLCCGKSKKNKSAQDKKKTN